MRNPCIEALSILAKCSTVKKLKLRYRLLGDVAEDEGNIPAEALSHLTDLTVVDIPIQKLMQLKSFFARSSSLKTLDMQVEFTPNIPNVDIREVLPSDPHSSSLASLRGVHVRALGFSLSAEAAGCMRNLTALHLENFSGSELAPFWGAMRTRGVRLQVLEVLGVTRALVVYLASYSGLQHLKTAWVLPYQKPELLPLADDIYGIVLRRHEDTVGSLRYSNGPSMGSWGVNEPILGNIIRCKKLRSLDLCFDTPPAVDYRISDTSLVSEFPTRYAWSPDV